MVQTLKKLLRQKPLEHQEVPVFPEARIHLSTSKSGPAWLPSSFRTVRMWRSQRREDAFLSPRPGPMEYADM
jgi:hypothetical protein